MIQSSNRFIIVGAGPVGLWTAIQLKKRMPNSEITIYERYTEYKRKHVLKIQHSSLFFGASRTSDDKDLSFFSDVFDSNRSKVKLTPLSKTFISTGLIESKLKAWALSFGIDIIYRPIETLDELLSIHGKESIYVLANGAHSSLRGQLLGDNDVKKTDLQYILELKTNLSKSKKEIKSTKANGAIKGKLRNMAFEYVGKSNSSKTPVSLRIFVDKDLYEEIPYASFKDPIKSFNGLPRELIDDLSEYASLHQLSIEDLFEEGQITKLQLSVYHAEKFASKYENAKFFLTGDAAMGVPYFRALNSGFVLSSRLAYILSKTKGTDSSISIYNAYQHIHRNAEEGLARGKNKALNSYNELRKLYRITGIKKGA